MKSVVPVTVVIPAYNAEPFLVEALDSIASQTRRPKEVIVVDDGSTDATAKIAEAHGATCIRQSQEGPSAARNRGIQEARTPWIAFLDSDDWFAPNKLEVSMRELEARRSKFLCTDAWQVKDGVPIRRKNAPYPVPESLDFETLLTGNRVICSSVVASRSHLLDAGGFNEDRELIGCEDYDLWLRLARIAPLTYLSRPLTHYRVHDNSLSGNDRFLRTVDALLSRVLETHSLSPTAVKGIRQQRAHLRLNIAWDMLREGSSSQARSMIAEANRYAWTWRGVKMRLSSRTQQ